MKNISKHKAVCVLATLGFFAAGVFALNFVLSNNSEQRLCEGSPNGCAPGPGYCVAPADGWIKCDKLNY